MKFYIADAFTDTILCGNPAGVVILPEGADFPADALMTRIAAELRYSETAFIKRLNAREFQIRYFTPAAEVELCGHATIASFKALLHGGYIEDDRSYINHTLSGDLAISISDGFVMMDMAEAKMTGEINDETARGELYSVMGLSYAAQKEKGLALRPQIISTGLPDIMLPVADQGELSAIAPDFPALSALSRHYGVVGVHAFTLDADDGILCRARNFAPLYGIDEEAATGTANGALTYYGYLNGFVRPGDECSILQGEDMGRPSVIRSSLRLDDHGNVRICVGGSGAVLVEGEIYI
ncbi:MAG: PhzF family phenazine biosynthesis protein [Eubacteriales bacterium]|nr:PhzF family phenazine biosynthesis protein [Eubacteriales bacterium]